ncbi:MAG: YbbR-like domain-containing protein [Prevotella sp.]|nr:YbbR-like domain-containing protein [Prevotella sp.]
MFFVLLSCIFWMMQVYRQKYEATLIIPVKYINVPDSIVFENELPKTIEVRIKDDGSTLFKYYLIRRTDSLVVDVRDAIKNTQEHVLQGNNFEQLIRTKLYATSELISYTPTRMSYSYALLHSKKLPVIFNGNVSLDAGYMLDGDLYTHPDSAMVYGSFASLDTIYFAYTESDTIRHLKSASKIKIRMQPIPGIKYIPNEVEVNIPVDEFIKKEVEVPITCINLPKNLTIKLFPSSVKIEFFVGKKRSDKIDSNNFEVTIDYNDIKDIKDITIPVRITDSPNYIRAMAPIPSEVEFVLEQQ